MSPLHVRSMLRGGGGVKAMYTDPAILTSKTCSSNPPLFHSPTSPQPCKNENEKRKYMYVFPREPHRKSHHPPPPSLSFPSSPFKATFYSRLAGGGFFPTRLGTFRIVWISNRSFYSTVLTICHADAKCKCKYANAAWYDDDGGGCKWFITWRYLRIIIR